MSSILITGGTGSFGQHCVRVLLERAQHERIVVFSRDELKQWRMRRAFGDDERLRFFIGDVRDAQRLRRAFAGVHQVIHAAALKQVPAAEYNPGEAVKTNVHGAECVIEAALDCGVRRIIALSTDKAVNPVNLYGATKLCAERLFIAGNAYAGANPTRFSAVRYGNVIGSRGSVVELFQEQARRGELEITDPRMTRFWLTLEQGVNFVLDRLDRMSGGEVYVPKIPSMGIGDLAEAIAPAAALRVVGIRLGEKLHETLVSEDEARLALEYPDRFTIYPGGIPQNTGMGKPLADGFSYRSDTNPVRLTIEQLRALL